MDGDEAQRVRAWVEGFRAAERRTREELRRSPPTTEESVRAAQGLIASAARTLGWPLPDGPSRRSSELEARACWDRLRRHGRR